MVSMCSKSCGTEGRPWRCSCAGLATRHEVLDHFAHCLDVIGDRVDMDARFGTSLDSAVERDGAVEIRYRTPDGSTGRRPK